MKAAPQQWTLPIPPYELRALNLYLDGYTYAEIAAELGWTGNTVHTALRRTRIRLRNAGYPTNTAIRVQQAIQRLYPDDDGSVDYAIHEDTT